MSALERRWDEGEHLATTSLNVAEILRGARGQRARLTTTVDVLAGLTELPFGPRASRRFGRLMHRLDEGGSRVPVVDGMIASIVLAEGARLYTRNTRDFDRVPDLELVEG